MFSRSSFARLLLLALLPVTCRIGAAVYDVDVMIGNGGLAKESAAMATKEILGRLKPGDAVLLSRRFASGDVDLSGIPDGITLEWGHGGRLILGPRTYTNLRVVNTDMDITGPAAPKGMGKSGVSASPTFIRNSHFSNTPAITNAQMAGSVIVDQRAPGGGRSPWEVSGNWSNNSLLYFWYHTGDKNMEKLIHFSNVDATNSCMYGIVEVNYCHPKVSVSFENTKGLCYGNGDTERHASPTGVYHFWNCSDMTVVCHRNYHPHSVCPQGNGYLVSGGANMTFFGVKDIGASAEWSFKASNSSNLRFYSTFFESQVQLAGSSSGAYRMFHTPDGFGDAPNTQWVAPAVIDEEVVLSYNGIIIDSKTAKAPDLSNVQLHKPPLIKPFAATAGAGKRRATAAAGSGWGSRLLAAGLDVSGRTSCSEIVQQSINSGDVVELPAGKLLFGRPVVFPRRPGKTIRIIGAGSDATMVRGRGGVQPFARETPSQFLARTGTVYAGVATVELHNLAVDGGGGDFCVSISGGAGYSDNNLYSGVTFTNSRIAGFFCGDATRLGDPTYYVNGDGYDQFRFKECNFTNTGDYGILSNREMIDKQLVYKCTFTGQKKAGISYMRSHMVEASSFVGCTFRNIDGPGIELGGNRKPGVGTATGPNMIMNCLFEECGNSTRPAVDYGWARLNMFVKNRIVTKTKPWKYGYMGTGTVFQQNDAEVDLTKAQPGALAFAMRHPRRWGNARNTGVNISSCRSNGKLGFIDDVDWFVKTYGDNVEMPAGSCEYPYAYTFLLADCEFDGGNQTYDFALVRTSKDARVLETIDLKTGAIQTGAKPPRSIGPALEAPTTAFSILGRSVAGANVRIPDSEVAAPGLYLLRSSGGQPLRRVRGL